MSRDSFMYCGVAAVCLLAPAVAFAQSYDDIREALFDATNEWRTENAGEIVAAYRGSGAPAIELARSRLLDEIIQRHVEDKAGCGYLYTGGAHVSCDGSTFADRARGRVSGGASENMQAGHNVPRDILLSDYGVSIQSIGFTPPACSTRFSSTITAPDGLDGVDTVNVCLNADGDPIVQGAIDVWDRSAGHRANMISATARTLGIGYAEGILDATGCTDSTRDANNHIINTAGCSIRPIAGQMFSDSDLTEGFYSVATQSQLGFFVPATDDEDEGGDEGGEDDGGGTGGGGTGGGTGGGGTGGGTGGGGTGGGSTVPPVATGAGGSAMTSNMRAVDGALLNLFLLYQVRDDLLEGGVASSLLLAEAAAAGYGDLTEEQIRNLPGEDSLGQLFDDIIGMTVDGINGNAAALTALAGVMRDVGSESHTVSGESATLSGMATDRILRQRLDIKRAAPVSASSLSEETRIAANQSVAELDGLLGVEQVLAANGYNDPHSNAWSRAYARYSKQDQDDILAGHETRDYGVVVGIELPMEVANAQVGAYAGAGQADTDYRGNTAETKTIYYQAGVYGTIGNEDNSLYVTTTAGGAYMQHEHSRNAVLGNVPTEAIKSEYDSWMVFASAGVGAAYQINQLRLQPEVSVAYYYHDIEAVTESGNSPLRLNVGERTEKTLLVRAGVSGSRKFYVFYDKELFLRGGVNYVFLGADGREHQSRAAIIPGSGGNFTIRGRDDRHYYEHEIGFELGLQPLLKLSGDYRLLADSTSKDHTFNVGVRYQF